MSSKYLFAIILILGCNRNETKYPLSFKSTIHCQKEIQYSKLQLDSLFLDSIPSSFLGETWIKNNSIYFIDKKFCFIDKFSLTGKFISRYMGQGYGKNELPIKTMMLFSPLDNGGFLIIGGHWDCYVFDSNFVQVNDYAINWHSSVSKEAMLNNYDASQSELYSISTFDFKINTAGNSIYIPIISQHPIFNPTNPIYFQLARTIALMNIENGYIEKIFGGFSPVYTKNNHNATFPYHYFTLTENNTFQIAYPADSLIYVSDRDFRVTRAYGFAGRDMDTSYTSVNKISLFRQNYLNVLKNKGYYTGLKFIPERSLLFRSYTKSAGQDTDGLQIYKNDTLIADLDVPKGFKVESYCRPYFYSNSFINEDKSTIKLYRFQIK